MLDGDIYIRVKSATSKEVNRIVYPLNYFYICFFFVSSYKENVLYTIFLFKKLIFILHVRFGVNSILNIILKFIIYELVLCKFNLKTWFGVGHFFFYLNLFDI